MSVWDSVYARMFPQRRWASPGALALALDHTTNQTPALELIDKALVKWHDTPESRLIITMSPQEGKSVRCSKWLPAWMLDCDPELRIVLASYADILSRRNGRVTRDVIADNPEVFDKAIREDLSAQNEWKLEGHEGGVFAVGVGGGLTGQPADRVIIDDPHKDRQDAESELMRDRVWDWWQDVVLSRLGATASVLVIMTRWHEDDLVGRLIERSGDNWEVLNIPAECVDPANDPLGRELGEFMVSARGRTREQWLKRKAEVGSRSWEALYQGHPTPTEGTIFLRKHVRFYDSTERPWAVTSTGQHVVQGGGRLIQSWDMTFKDKKDSDWVVGQVWLRRGAEMWLLDQVRDRLSFTATCEAMRAMTVKWPQALRKIVEDKANGTAVIDHLRREISGLVPVEPVGGKVSRAESVSPLWEAGNVRIPKDSVAPWSDKYISEMASFPNGVNDDQVDATSQALYDQMIRPGARTTGTRRIW